MIDSKQQIRQQLIAARGSIPDFARQTKARKITGSLSQLVPWEKFSSAHIYEPISSLREVDTQDFIGYLKQTYSLLAIFTSRQVYGKWKNVSLDGEEAEGINFDVIVVPTLGFDDSLNRLGYGGGYYDRFLSKQRQALTVGLCFEEGHVKKLPVEKHDIGLEYVISDRQIYHS